MVTALQRAGGALNANLHFHTLVLDGVFTEASGGALTRLLAPPLRMRYELVLSLALAALGVAYLKMA
jgi:hypothetical protein